MVVAADDVLEAGALDELLEDELPHPAANAPIEAAARNNSSGLWIIDLVLPDHAWSKIITTLRSSGSTLTVTLSPSVNGFDGYTYWFIVTA